jgi:hypothetical protein
LVRPARRAQPRCAASVGSSRAGDRRAESQLARPHELVDQRAKARREQQRRGAARQPPRLTSFGRLRRRDTHLDAPDAGEAYTACLYAQRARYYSSARAAERG